MLTSASCKKVEKLFTFSIYNESSIILQANVPINLPINVNTPNVTTNSSDQFENNNSDAAHVKDIRLKNLLLTITSPSGKNFDFLKSIQIFISTDANNEIELASLDNIPTNTASIALLPTSEKLDNYLKSGTINLRTTYVKRQLQSQDVEVKVNSEFTVKASVR
ncbi:MAG: hypothetical protein PSX81_04715 [bacterium]|nr:hypothetical protein [bacterium]